MHGRAMMMGMRRVAGFFRGLMGAVSGTAAVEFSLFLFFILMPFLFGIFEIGRALEQHHVVTKLVRDEARYIARMPGYDPATPFEVNCAETGAIVGATTPAGDAKDLAMYGKFRPVLGDTPLMAAWIVTADDSTAYQTVCITGPVEVTTVTSNLKINVVTVTAMVPFEDILLQAFGIGPITFDVSHQERYIGE